MCNSLLINDVVIDWEKIDQGSYLRDIIAFSGVVQISFDHAVAFLAGENGSGKSTLLEAIAIVYGFNPKGGMRYYKFSTNVSHFELCSAIRLSRDVWRARYGYFL